MKKLKTSLAQKKKLFFSNSFLCQRRGICSMQLQQRSLQVPWLCSSGHCKYPGSAFGVFPTRRRHCGSRFQRVCAGLPAWVEAFRPSDIWRFQKCYKALVRTSYRSSHCEQRWPAAPALFLVLSAVWSSLAKPLCPCAGHAFLRHSVIGLDPCADLDPDPNPNPVQTGTSIKS